MYIAASPRISLLLVYPPRQPRRYIHYSSNSAHALSPDTCIQIDSLQNWHWCSYARACPRRACSRSSTWEGGGSGGGARGVAQELALVITSTSNPLVLLARSCLPATSCLSKSNRKSSTMSIPLLARKGKNQCRYSIRLNAPRRLNSSSSMTLF